ncbi:hypothetical protein PF005_g16943 [Phytophthora fragariae]|nr:hypothetical protein PF003_g17757 [Phytophthora fragariae]KAE8931753.1 hypothetical protein PF009_g18197 [Phytophthora fragariae]KAE9026266.1 hypothetical protein PF011_g2633 [Phytophthora fragariae]KAE9128881.1 hypothetical protein PF006_g16166 [Phytophthora fragariae]KAE9133081.1 hypothetical protein PF010_g2941 [Phytophthora fragariae]
MWKEKLLTHINNQDQLHKRKQLEKVCQKCVC